MKKLFFTLLTALVALVAAAQYERFDQSNSVSITAITEYMPDGTGFLFPVNDMPVNAVDSVNRIYAFDKKTKTAYVQTERGNYAVVLKDDVAKQVKKDKSVKKLKGSDLQAEIGACDLTLKWNADRYNTDHRAYLKVLREQKRQKQIEDSIREARRQDSLARIREAREQQKLAEYRATHYWRKLPLDGTTLRCDLPDCDSKESGDTAYCVGIVNDTIYYITYEDFVLGTSIPQVHLTHHRLDAQKTPNMAYHIKAFADSLAEAGSLTLTPELASAMNSYSASEGIEMVKKAAPYGFVNEWGWDDNYGTLTFNISYTNLNKKTIKYIDVYWVLKNDVNDNRGSGHFKGTGPVEYLNSSSWEWDNSPYYVYGDATNMFITKIILTYMNGSTKVLSAKEIFYDE